MEMEMEKETHNKMISSVCPKRMITHNIIIINSTSCLSVVWNVYNSLTRISHWCISLPTAEKAKEKEGRKKKEQTNIFQPFHHWLLCLKIWDWQNTGLDLFIFRVKSRCACILWMYHFKTRKKIRLKT